MAKNQSSLEFLKSDIPAGLVVFLVALPLCLGIALASGAPLISGVIAGIVGGVVISLLSGSQVSVSGPAAGLTVIVIDAIATQGSYEKFLVAVILSGAIQVGFGLFRVGFIANYVPISVLQGMMAAIGLVIILKQIPHALGWHADHEGDFSFWSSPDHGNTLDELANSLMNFTPGAVIITVACLAILLSWDYLVKHLSRSLRHVPASLVAVIAGLGLNRIFTLYFPELGLTPGGEHLVELPLIAENQSLLSVLPRPDFSVIVDMSTWRCAATIAIVGSLESLLSIEAADKLDPQRRISDTNRELFAQGTGNMLSGFLGGLPVTSVVVRTSANIYAGSRTRFSSFFHGLFLLAALFLIPETLNQVPLSALAAVLLVIGYKLCSPKQFKQFYQLGYVQFVPFLITIIAIVFSDLLTGVLLGLFVGVFFVLKASHHAVFILVNQEDHYLLRFNKDVSFLNKSELKEKLSTIPAHSSLILDGTKAMNIDHDICDILNDYRRAARFKHIDIELRHINLKG